jgi:hypothetical protein
MPTLHHLVVLRTKLRAVLKTPIHLGLCGLRRAIRTNIASFHSQTSALLKHPAADVQVRFLLS